MKGLKFDIQRFVETINGTAGHDNITVTSSQQFINALGGNDTVFNAFGRYSRDNYSSITVNGGDGSDSINSGASGNLTNDVVIWGGAGNDWLALWEVILLSVVKMVTTILLLAIITTQSTVVLEMIIL